jgi:hypothetical protein
MDIQPMYCGIGLKVHEPGGARAGSLYSLPFAVAATFH